MRVKLFGIGCCGKWHELADKVLHAGITPDIVSSNYPDLIAQMNYIQTYGYAPLVESMPDEEQEWYAEQCRLQQEPKD